MSASVKAIWLRSRGRIRGIAFVDAADYETVRRHRWNLSGGYAISGVGSMHRFILRLERGDPRVVHHINENALDNRRVNLMVCANASVANAQPHPKRDAASRPGYESWLERKRGVAA